MQNKKTLLFAAPIVLVLLGLAYYFLYFVKTPSYAVNQVRQAIEQRDVNKFQEHVDLDAVFDKAFEDLLVTESKLNNDKLLSNPIALNVLHLLKPTVIQLVKEDVLRQIARTSGDSTSDKGPVADAMRRNLLRRAHLDNMTYKSMKLDQESPTKSSVNVVFHNDDLDKDFAFRLTLLKSKENVWKVKEIANLADIVMQMDAADKAKRAGENTAVLNRLKQNLSVHDKHLQVTKLRSEELAEKIATQANTPSSHMPTTVVDKDALEPCLYSKVLFRNISSKTILRAYYDVEILDKNKKPFYSYPEQFNGSIAPNATQEVIAIKRLNEQLPDDRALASLKDTELECNITVTYISFEDGSDISPNPYL